MDKILNMLGLMRRANAIQIGETNTGSAVRAGKAKLLLLASDASDNAKSRAEGFVRGRNVTTVSLPYAKEAVGQTVGRGVCAILAVTDIGFAAALAAALAQGDPGQYGPAAQQLAAKAEKAERRRREQRAHEKKLRGQGRTVRPYIPTRIKRAGNRRRPEKGGDGKT